MAKNLQESLEDLLNERSKFQQKEKELLILLNEFASSSNGTRQDYDVLCDIAADIAQIYAKLRSITAKVEYLQAK